MSVQAVSVADAEGGRKHNRTIEALKHFMDVLITVGRREWSTNTRPVGVAPFIGDKHGEKGERQARQLALYNSACRQNPICMTISTFQKYESMVFNKAIPAILAANPPAGAQDPDDTAIDVELGQHPVDFLVVDSQMTPEEWWHLMGIKMDSMLNLRMLLQTLVGLAVESVRVPRRDDVDDMTAPQWAQHVAAAANAAQAEERDSVIRASVPSASGVRSKPKAHKKRKCASASQPADSLPGQGHADVRAANGVPLGAVLHDGEIEMVSSTSSSSSGASSGAVSSSSTPAAPAGARLSSRSDRLNVGGMAEMAAAYRTKVEGAERAKEAEKQLERRMNFVRSLRRPMCADNYDLLREALEEHGISLVEMDDSELVMYLETLPNDVHHWKAIKAKEFRENRRNERGFRNFRTVDT